MRRVYLDNNATTPVLPEVFETMQAYFGERFGNASSIHHHGQETRAAVERARESVAALLGGGASEIVFTSGGTEGDNLAIFGLTRPGLRGDLRSRERPRPSRSRRRAPGIAAEYRAHHHHDGEQ
jgi:cysteine sulfinate desulfinase/cysteine desulfurase-like protein